jgi:hypothetical protein
MIPSAALDWPAGAGSVLLLQASGPTSHVNPELFTYMLNHLLLEGDSLLKDLCLKCKLRPSLEVLKERHAKSV